MVDDLMTKGLDTLAGSKDLVECSRIIDLVGHIMDLGIWGSTNIRCLNNTTILENQREIQAACPKGKREPSAVHHA